VVVRRAAILMPLCLAALASAPLGAQSQQQPKDPRDAPYETKLTCGIYNAILADFYGEQPDAGQQFEARSEAWIESAVTEKGDEAQVGADIEKTVNEMLAEYQALQNGPLEKLFAWFDKHKAVCEPYEG